MKKIKILHLTTDSKIGGTEKMLITLAENYDRNKFEMIFVTLIGDGELLNELIMRGCKAYSINMRSKLEIYKILRLYKILKNEKPDILNTYLFHADQLGRILGKIAGIKIIVSSFRSPDYWKKKIHILIEKFTALFADCFTANSELAKNIVVDREKISASKIYVIKNGIKIEDNKFNGEISELKLKNNVPSDKIVIGTVANITPVKNYQMFVDICAELNKNYDNLYFISIGAGPELESIKNYAQSKNVKINFWGYRNDANNLTKIFDILVLTSKWESSSRAVLEAMANAAPIVCGNVGGLNELVINNKTGFLCEYDKSDFVEKIKKLIESEELRKSFGNAGYNYAKNEYSLDVFINKTQDLYENLYNQKRKKIKVFEIVTRLNIGGPAVNVIYLSALLNKNIFDVKLITGQEAKEEGNMFYLCQQKKVDYIFISELRRELNAIRDFIALIKIIWLMIKYRPNIVHTHTAKAGTIGRLAAILTFRKKIIHTFHGNIFDGYFSQIKTNFFIMIERILAIFTDKIISVSNAQRSEYINLGLGNYNKIINIPLGLELDIFKNAALQKKQLRKKYNLADDIIVISIVARLVPIKNHKLLIDAVNLLKDKFSNFKVYIIGGGELEDYLKNYIANLKLQNFFEFVGFVSDQLPEYYAITDITVLTSINEGLPTVIIEALAAQNAVVAANVGGVVDLIKDEQTGLLCKSNDAADLTEKLYRLCSDKNLRNKLAQSGQQFVLNNYSVEKLIENFERLYQTI